MADKYTEALRSMASHFDEGEADRLRELLALLEAVGDEGDWTEDSYLLMSLASPAMEEDVLQLLAYRFAGEAGKLRRQAWDERRAALKREFELKQSGSAE
jgi:hypothetical protein